MGLFFSVETDADKRLLDDYDEAVRVFRAEVGKAMEDAALKKPELQKALHTAAEALRARPLPSEANSDEAALRRLTLSSLTVEMIFAKLHAKGETETVMEIAARMKNIGKTTTGRPEFKDLTAAVLKAVAGLKEEVALDMESMVFDLYIAEIKKPAPAQNRRRPDRLP